MLLRARVSLLDRPGSLLAVVKVIADLGGNIVDIEILATADGRVVDDLVIDMPSDDPELLTERLATTGAELLNCRRTVRLSGQRPDLDLLHRIAAEPATALATMASLAPPIWSADWAVFVAVSAPDVVVRSSPGAPSPLPTNLPIPIGPLPRRANIETVLGQRLEVVGTGWGNHILYLGRADGPAFLQVELIQLRRVIELAQSLLAAQPAS